MCSIDDLLTCALIPQSVQANRTQHWQQHRGGWRQTVLRRRRGPVHRHRHTDAHLRSKSKLQATAAAIWLAFCYRNANRVDRSTTVNIALLQSDDILQPANICYYGNMSILATISVVTAQPCRSDVTAVDTRLDVFPLHSDRRRCGYYCVTVHNN